MTDNTVVEPTPLVSVIVTTYNRPQLVKRALRSVRAQTYEPLEFIVVKDGTETGIDKWLEEELSSAQYVCHGENRGLAAARNTGLDYASGEYVAYLDDDDEWKPKRIERQIQTLLSVPPDRRGAIGVVYCGLERRNPDGSVRSVGHPENTGELRASIKRQGASTLPSTFLFAREALRDVGGFDESLSSSIDHDIWMSLATGGYHAITVDEALVVTYVSETEDMTTDTDSRIEGVRQYVDKWTPVYQEWFGPAEGIRYGERYFARVTARLVGKLVASGAFDEAWTATREIFKSSSQYRYNATILATLVSKRVVTKLFSQRSIDRLRAAKQYVRS